MIPARGRCDHDPRRPRFRLETKVSPRLPWITKTAMKRAENFYLRPQRFPEFTLEAEAARGARVAHRRSTIREAVALVTKALMRMADRRTWRVGTPRDDGLCTGLPIAQIVKQTGLSRPRVCRAIRELEEAGYIESSQPVEELEEPKVRPNGTLQTHRGFPSVRWITPLFTRRLGISDKKRAAAVTDGAAAWRRKRSPAASPVALAGVRRARRELLDPDYVRKAQEARLARLAASQAAGPATGPTPELRPSVSFRQRAEARLERLRPKPRT